MEPPSKRPRFSFAQDLDPEDETEADWDTAAEDNVDQEPGVDGGINLEEARARNDQRLKSIFESIFAKYEKDFTEVGDEIDLQSGRIIVNNGHLQRMEGEDDTGEKHAQWLALSTPADEYEEEDYDGDDYEDGGNEDGYEIGDGQPKKWSEVVRDNGGEDGGEDGSEDADDTSSVDSLLDSALSVNRADKTHHPEGRTASLASTKKARSPIETAGGLDRVHNAVACSHTTTTATTNTHELVDPKWRVPDIQPAVFSSRLVPKAPAANSKKKPTHSSDKTTTITNATTATIAPSAFAHSVSPPGGRSLWAVPLPGRPRKTNTDGQRPKKTKRDKPGKPAKHPTGIGAGLESVSDKEQTGEKAIPAGNGKVVEPAAATPTRTSATKLKPYSSPMIASNWSLSSLLGGHSGSGSGSDSDDPLQEYQPSPTPTSTASVVRGGLTPHATTTTITTPSRAQSTTATTTRLRSLSQSPSQSRCNGCRRLFPGNEEHVLHLRSVLASGLPDGLHDGPMVRRILEKIDDAYAYGDWSASGRSPRAKEFNSYGSTRSTPSLEAYESPPPPSPPAVAIATGDSGVAGAAGAAPPPLSPSLPQPRPRPLPGSSKREDRVQIQQDTSDTTTKPKHHRARARAATPDEAKLIITMRHVHRKPWKEILDYFPEKRLSNLIQWNQLHWTERRARPPPSSGPWSGDERGRLAVIKDEQGLSWAAIRKRLPRRTTMEIEFELLRLWVGETIWHGDGQGHLAESAEVEADTVPVSGHGRGRGRLQQTDGSGDFDKRTFGEKIEIPDSRETSLGLSDQDVASHGHAQQQTRPKSNADSFGILYEDQQQPFDSIEYDDDDE